MKHIPMKAKTAETMPIKPGQVSRVEVREDGTYYRFNDDLLVPVVGVLDNTASGGGIIPVLKLKWLESDLIPPKKHQEGIK